MYLSACKYMYEKLFYSNRHHLLHPLLPPQREQHYSFRDRSHNLQLHTRTSSLKVNNFLISILFKDVTLTCAFLQWLCFILYCCILKNGLSWIILLKHDEWMNIYIYMYGSDSKSDTHSSRRKKSSADLGFHYPGDLLSQARPRRRPLQKRNTVSDFANSKCRQRSTAALMSSIEPGT